MQWFIRVTGSVAVCLTVMGCATHTTSQPGITADQLKLPGKKGACFTLRDPAKSTGGTWKQNLPKVQKLQAYWNYSWGANLIPEQKAYSDSEFIPMIWGAWGPPENLEGRLQKELLPQFKDGKMKRLLGFNEPDKKNQANMPYMKAITCWPALMKMNVPLCSPACANSEGINDESTQGVPGTWMRDFMKEADARGYRVDYVGVHWYGGTGVEHFKAKMRRIYDKYGKRPLLITEFAPADWRTGGDHAKNDKRVDKVLAFAKEILPWMEEQDWIAGYAWFSFGIHEPQGHTSALFNYDGSLTPLGRYYASITNENPKGDQSIEADDADTHLAKVLDAARQHKKTQSKPKKK